jgi:hypothetical protein
MSPISLSLQIHITYTLLTSFNIVSCIDFRVSVEEFLGIKREGNLNLTILLPSLFLLTLTTEATIILNAGARVNKSITDLLFLDNFTRGQIKDVIVIHHTGKSIIIQGKINNLLANKSMNVIRLWLHTLYRRER